jgi:uncharacterized phage-associated protein
MDHMKIFNPEKAVNAVLYVAARLGTPADVYASLKAIYFADKDHLDRFGRTMFGESYYAMEHGPVPSATYDLVKSVGGRVPYAAAFPGASDALFADHTKIYAKREADLDCFSRSELLSLDKGIELVRGKSFSEIKKMSHDQAWKRADHNGEMSLESIAEMIDESGALLSHLKDRFPGQAENP